MSRIGKIIIICIAAGLVFLVLGLCFGASTEGLYLDKAGIHLVSNDETRITEPDLENVKNINVEVSSGDVAFISAEKFGLDIQGYGTGWNWGLEDGTLRVEQEEKNGWSLSIFNTGFHNKNTVKIYVPQGAKLENVSVKTSSGDMKVGGFLAGDVQIGNSYGNVDLNDITSGRLQINLSSGDFTGVNLNAQDVIYKNSYGDARFEKVDTKKLAADSSAGDFLLRDCKAEDASIKNSYGTITADGLFSSKTSVSADSGDISLNGAFSGETVIRSSYGNITFTTDMKKEYYDYDISTSYGEVIFDHDKSGSNATVKSGGNTSENSLKINASSGDIEVYFAQ